VQLEEHTYTSHRTPVNFNALLQSSLTGCGRLESSIVGSITVDVTVAKLTLDEAMSNALKYRRPGTDICITARLDDGMVHVSVSNLNPLGFEVLSAEECVRVFQPGYKSHLASAMSDGVGLDSVARAIAAAHGSVRIQCDADAETTAICFSLPAHAVATTQKNPLETRSCVPSPAVNPRPAGSGAPSSVPSGTGAPSSLRRETRTDSLVCPGRTDSWSDSVRAADPRSPAANTTRPDEASSHRTTHSTASQPTRRVRQMRLLGAKLTICSHGVHKTTAEWRAAVAAIRAVLNGSDGASRRIGASDTLGAFGLDPVEANYHNTLPSSTVDETMRNEHDPADHAATPAQPAPLASSFQFTVTNVEPKDVPCRRLVAPHSHPSPGADVPAADKPGPPLDVDLPCVRAKTGIRPCLTDHYSDFGTSSCGLSSASPSLAPLSSTFTSGGSWQASPPQPAANSPLLSPQKSRGLETAAPARSVGGPHAREGRRKLRCVGMDDEDLPRMILRVLFTYHLDADPDASCAIGQSAKEQEAFIDVAMGVRNPDLSYTEGEPVQADVVLLDENINESAIPPILGSLLSAELRMCGFKGIIVICTGAPSSTIQHLRSQPGVDLAFGKEDGLPSIAADITSLYDQRCAAAQA
jgi:hypothetical protein